MLDALLAALPDSAFFKQMEFTENFRQKLRSSDIPFAGYLRGASTWDLSREPGFPIYAIAKTNTEDNIEPKVGYGSMVLSSTETGELLIYPMKDESGKMPLANPRKPSRSPSDLPRAKTYSVDDLWRTLGVKDMRGGYGEYLAFLHMGGFQSQPYRFFVETGRDNPPIRPYETFLIDKEFPGKGESGIKEVTFTIPPVGDSAIAFGLSLVLGKAHLDNGISSHPVTGSFKFSGPWPDRYERLPLHILVSVSEVKDISLNTLWLPRSKCQFKDGTYSGRFQFDLSALFLTPWDGKPKLPKRAWISAVHRGWRGPVEKHIFDSLP